MKNYMDPEPRISITYFLIVENDAPSLAALKETLGRIEHYFFDVVSSYAEALIFLDRESPDLILLTYDLGGSRCREGFHKITQEFPAYRIIISYPQDYKEGVDVNSGIRSVQKGGQYIPDILAAIQESLDQLRSLPAHHWFRRRL